MPKRGTEEILDYFSGQGESCSCPSCLKDLLDLINEWEENAASRAKTFDAAARVEAVYERIRNAVSDIVLHNFAQAVWEEAGRSAEGRRFSYGTNFAMASALIEAVAHGDIEDFDSQAGLIVDFLLDAAGRSIRTVRRFLYAARRVCPELDTAAKEARRRERAQYGA